MGNDCEFGHPPDALKPVFRKVWRGHVRRRLRVLKCTLCGMDSTDPQWRLRDEATWQVMHAVDEALSLE